MTPAKRRAIFSALGATHVQATDDTWDMWLFVIVPVVAALYGVYLRFVLTKYSEMEEAARRKFIYVVGAVALVLIALDFLLVR